MVLTGLDIVSGKLPDKIKRKSVSVLCHAPSITRKFEHIIDLLANHPDLRLASVMGPQHGLFGQTQDNMIEWEGHTHIKYGVPVYSLYGKNRKPTKSMLEGTEVFIIDLQDIGARPYTYIWSMKLCMEACREENIPVWILDRPNPVAKMGMDGPVLKREYFTFVGGAEIPLMHSLTIGELAMYINKYEDINCDLNVIWMDGWDREMMFNETGLPWVAPSPNMPSLDTAITYPGMVLVEALNISEARGTTTPFELFGAPGLNIDNLINNLRSRSLPGCNFRAHDFIPTFNKFKDIYCSGVQIHVTDREKYEPVYTAINVFEAIDETTPGYLKFNQPPYEYEYKLMPFDILMGDRTTREILESGGNIEDEKIRWKDEISDFKHILKAISHYG